MLAGSSTAGVAVESGSRGSGGELETSLSLSSFGLTKISEERSVEELFGTAASAAATPCTQSKGVTTDLHPAAETKLMAVAFASIYIFGVVGSLPILLAYFLIGAGKSAVIVNFYAMTADAVDYGHWKLGARAESYSFGFLSLANKAGTAIGGGLLGLLLDWSGLIVNARQTDQTLDRLWAAICLAPAGLAVASAVVVLFFRVTALKHREIVMELQAREGGL